MASDIFEELIREHQEMRKMSARLQERYDKKGFKEFEEHATAHMEAEESVLYKQIEDDEQMREKVLEAYEEHHFLNLALRELRDREPGTERWMAKFQVAAEMNEHHMKEEEEDMFPSARPILGERSMELGERYEKEHEAQMARA